MDQNEEMRIAAADFEVMRAEIRAVLLASLEAKVESLDEDGWMFGDEVKEDE